MAFAPAVVKTVSHYFDEHSFHLITPKMLFSHLQHRYPQLLHGHGSIPKPFFFYLQSYGLVNNSRVAFLLFQKQCPYSMSELKLKFFFEMACLVYRKNQRNNFQVFLYNLLLKWTGKSIHGRSFVNQTIFKMPASTFYRKMDIFAKQVKQNNIHLLQSNRFVIWIDNFTKICSRNYVFQEDGKNYSMYNLTVAAAFMFPARERTINNTLMFNRSAQAPLCHGSQVFEAIDSVAFALPHEDSSVCIYKRYEGDHISFLFCFV